jgi:hypothetical protein
VNLRLPFDPEQEDWILVRIPPSFHFLLQAHLEAMEGIAYPEALPPSSWVILYTPKENRSHLLSWLQSSMEDLSIEEIWIPTSLMYEKGLFSHTNLKEESAPLPQQ